MPRYEKHWKRKMNQGERNKSWENKWESKQKEKKIQKTLDEFTERK